MNTVGPNAQDPKIEESNALWERAKKIIPSGTQTLAKGPQQNVDGVAPKYLKKAKGARVWDVDGNEYLDYQMAIGPISLGYNDDKVDQAVKEQLEDGVAFSLMHPLEVEVAEQIHQIIPNAESVRFAKTGAEVTSAAIRAARAFTGREKVLCCGYHGWHDWYISVTDKNRGIPKAVQSLTYTVNYNDLDHLASSLDKDIACFILEPMTFVEPKEEYLTEVKRLCEQNGTLLIFDEIWTGFRLGMGGAQERYSVTPDLATYSKAIANGFPISVLTGRKDVMNLFEEDVFFYSTFGGEALSLAATKATLNEMQSRNFPKQVAEKGRILQDGYNSIAKDLDLTFTKCIGHPARSLMTFDASAGNPLEMKSFVQQEMIRRGILWGGFHNICLAHTDEDLKYTLDAYKEVLPLLAEAVSSKSVASKLRGKPVGPVFRKTTQFNSKPKS